MNDTTNIISYQKFLENVIKQLPDYLTGEYSGLHIESTHVEKVNYEYDGLYLHKAGSSIGATMDLQHIYDAIMQDDVSMDTAMMEISARAEEAVSSIGKFGWIGDIDAQMVRENAYLAVISMDKNREILRNIPYEKIEGTDLAAIVKIHIGEDAVGTVTNEHLSYVGLSIGETLDIARRNTMMQPFKVAGIEETLREMLPEEMRDYFPVPEKQEMVVVTRENTYEGANVLCDTRALDTAAEKLDAKSIIILPSSRHEVICVPESSEVSVEGLQDMVADINKSEVSVEDRLTDSVYRYDSRTHKIEMADTMGRFPEYEKEQTVSHSHGRG